MKFNDWQQRALIFVQRLWQPTSSCMACMPGGWLKLWSIPHWSNALQTGLITGVLAVLLSFTPLGRLYRHRYGNAAMVGGMTTLGDYFSHPGQFGGAWGEALTTGAVSALLALGASFLFEDRARRLRSIWTRMKTKARQFSQRWRPAPSCASGDELPLKPGCERSGGQV